MPSVSSNYACLTLFPNYVISIHSTPFVHRMCNQWSLLTPITAGDEQGCVTPPKEPESSPESSNPKFLSLFCLLQKSDVKAVLFVAFAVSQIFV